MGEQKTHLLRKGEGDNEILFNLILYHHNLDFDKEHFWEIKSWFAIGKCPDIYFKIKKKKEAEIKFEELYKDLLKQGFENVTPSFERGWQNGKDEEEGDE